MKDHYFYQDRGKTIGPIDIDEVRSRIKDGRLKLFDLVYRDGDESWRMALEHSALRSEFKTSTIASMKTRPWVCLQRKGDAETAFHTTGPYTQDEIHEALQAGRLSYSDYAWKDGFQDWKRIGALEEFNPRVRTATAAMQPVPEATGKELLRNVVELKRPQVKIEKPPAEAKTPDLTAAETPPPMPVSSSSSKRNAKSASKPRLAPVVAEEEVLPPEKEKRKSRRLRFAVDWGLLGVTLLLLSGVALIASRFVWPGHWLHKSEITQGIETGPLEMALSNSGSAGEHGGATDEGDSRSEDPAQLPGANAPSENEDGTADALTAANRKKDNKTAKDLVLKVHTVGSNQAQIEIRTDASPDTVVYLQVVGLPGQVTEGPAYYRFLHYTPSGNPQQPLDLSKLKLPQGRYILRAETGKLKREARLNMGTSDPTFKASVMHQRKLSAQAIWRERLNLFRLSQLLEKQIAQGMIPTKKFSSKGLDEVNAVKRSGGAKYLLFDEWWELHEIMQESKAGLTPKLLARAQKSRDRISSFSVWK